MCVCGGRESIQYSHITAYPYVVLRTRCTMYLYLVYIGMLWVGKPKILLYLYEVYIDKLWGDLRTPLWGYDFFSYPYYINNTRQEEEEGEEEEEEVRGSFQAHCL